MTMTEWSYNVLFDIVSTPHSYSAVTLYNDGFSYSEITLYNNGFSYSAIILYNNGFNYSAIILYNYVSATV